jgi:tripartite-type tricarboxylate transporter receptor subunit TctC
MEMFLKMAGLKAQHVPYRGSLPALTDVLSGQIPFMIVDIAPALALIKEGKVKALAVPSPMRVEALPDVPTFAEAGLAGYSATGWFSVVTRAGTPKTTTDKLNRILTAYLKRADVRDKLQGLAIQTLTSTPDELRRHISAETAKWAQVVKDTGIARQ